MNENITWLAVACTGSVDLYFVLQDREIGPNFETIGGSNGISSSVLSEQTDMLLLQQVDLQYIIGFRIHKLSTICKKYDNTHFEFNP